jgi:hypothetical protein
VCEVASWRAAGRHRRGQFPSLDVPGATTFYARGNYGTPGESAPPALPPEPPADDEERASHVQRVAFERESARPEVVLSFRYDEPLRRDAAPFWRDAGFAPPPKGW